MPHVMRIALSPCKGILWLLHWPAKVAEPQLMHKQTLGTKGYHLLEALGGSSSEDAWRV